MMFNKSLITHRFLNARKEGRKNANGDPQQKKRRRYRTRMFDNRLSFPTSSEQVRQLQAESEAEERSVASLIREAIDQFLPRLRNRRRKRQRTPGKPLADAPKVDNRLQRAVRRLLGDPQKQKAVLTKTDPPPGRP